MRSVQLAKINILFPRPKMVRSLHAAAKRGMNDRPQHHFAHCIMHAEPVNITLPNLLISSCEMVWASNMGKRVARISGPVSFVD